LTEYLAGSHEAMFDVKYDAVIGELHPAWQELYQSLKANPLRFRFLNAAQLVKHALGLKRYAGEEPVTLSYLWWEPTNASLVRAVVQHRAEVAEFAASVAAARDVVFSGMPAPAVWDEWIGHPDPAVHAHGEALAARYRLAI
jgi:hypothetical protein